MNNKKEAVISKKYQKYIRSNVFLFILFSLSAIACVVIVSEVFSAESIKKKVNPFYGVVILALIFYVLVLIADRCAKSGQFTNSWMYHNLLGIGRGRSSRRVVISLIFIIILVIIVAIRWIFRVIL